MSSSEELEKEAIRLWRENRFFLSLKPETKNFFRDVADFNKWEKLKEELQK